MSLLSICVAVVLLVGVRAQVSVLRPPCDSSEAEEAAYAAQDYINGQHHHGYKFKLNQIEDFKIIPKLEGDIYVLEIELLETECYVLDPTPLANCTVRPKIMTAVEADCDVVLRRIGGAMTVIAFKCKTEEEIVDPCTGCPLLLPLNNTAGLDLVRASLVTFNNRTENETFTLLEVGKLYSQIVSGQINFAEYVVIEANCTDEACPPLKDPMAARGICSAKGLIAGHTVDCKMFSVMMPIVDSNSTAAPALPPMVHTGSLSHKHGLRHHKLTAIHDPHLSDYLSAESAESVEVVPVAPTIAGTAAPAPTDNSATTSDSSASTEVPILLMKRDVGSADVLEVADPISFVPICPGRIRYF